jgi:crotonobetainyl-CoA:carnitine CoA-transferase CaiB-like acyl-CoA transferase
MLPLQNVRIVAVEQYGAGPIGTLYLASLGAEIIKIENPRDGGDVSRTVGPHFVEGVERSAASLFFQGLNHNKKSLSLDLSREDGRSILHRLVADADALASNLRGDVPAKLGITYSQLAAHNPKLVCAHLTAYGRQGPRAAWPGYDFMMQAEAGYFAMTGEPDGPPTRFGLSIVDFMTGLAMAFGLTAALVDARQSGFGRDIDVSLFDVAIFNLNYVATWYLNANAVPQRAPRSAHLSLTPCQMYRTLDGYIYLMCNKEKFWGSLCDEIGYPQWKDDPRFASYAARLENREQLTLLMDAALARQTTTDWLTRFKGKVPAAPVLDVPKALENPFVADSDRIQRVPLAGGSDIRVLRSPIRCEDPSPMPTAAPRLGEHTDDILQSLGYDSAAIAEFRRRGTI